jgi:hypothetical protein
MILKGNENPYLRGKAPKTYLPSPSLVSWNPFENLNESQRAEAASNLGKHYTDSFLGSLTRLMELCRTCNFFQLLAHFGYYDQLFLDPEKEGRAYRPIPQSSAELLQALILQIPEKELSSQLDIPPPPETIIEVNKLLGGIANSFSLKRYGTGTTKKDLLSEIARAHTVSVRNEGFPSQIRSTLHALLTPLDETFASLRKVKLTGLFRMLWNIGDLIGVRINDDFKLRRAVFRKKNANDIVREFLKLHCTGEAEASRFREELSNAKLKLQDLRGYLNNLWDRQNFRLFYLSLEDFVSAYPEPADNSVIEQAILFWSLEFGSLASTNPEHFFLDNPVWAKPIIHVGPNRFFFPLPGLVQSFGQHLIEAIIRTDSAIWERYQSKVRSAYLEKATANLFRAAVPSAKVLEGVHWTKPTSDQRYETDLLVILDSHVLVVECKAGHITDRARRGDSVRLEKDLGRLIEEPTLQGQRFARLLLTAGEPFEVEDSTRAKHLIDGKRFLRISRINITLDYLGPVGVQARLLRELRIVSKDLEPAATLHLHELENVIELLDQPALLFHYLHRRAEIEAANDLLTGEGGLLALYLATGFDLGDFEGAESHSLALPTMEHELEPYFMGKELHRPVPKPKRRLTGWWKDILASLEKRQTLGWMESSFALLSVGYERQKEFERLSKKVLNVVKSNWRDPNHENGCFLIAGSPKRRLKVLFVGVKNVTLEKQRDSVSRAITVADDKVSTAGTVAIVRSASTRTYPYSAVYLAGPDYEARFRGNSPLPS